MSGRLQSWTCQFGGRSGASAPANVVQLPAERAGVRLRRRGDWHLPAGFFPAILGVTGAAYADDPAECPNATDKAFLPQGRQDNQPVRAGVCTTSAKIIHLRTVPDGKRAGRKGGASEPGPRLASTPTT
jgi:hypothetical protein